MKRHKKQHLSPSSGPGPVSSTDSSSGKVNTRRVTEGSDPYVCYYVLI